MKVKLYGTDICEAELTKDGPQVVVRIEDRTYGPWDCNFMQLVEATDEERKELQRAGFHLMEA